MWLSFCYSLVFVQVAALLSMIAAVYMRIFLKESVSDAGMRQPILKEGGEPNIEEFENHELSGRTTRIFKRLPSVRDLICLLKSR